MKSFVDTFHRGELTFERLKNIKDIERLKSSLRELIEEDPYFFKPHVLLYEILEGEGSVREAKELLEKAYRRVLELIRLPSGKLPDNLPPNYESNRHILELLTNYGVFLWETGDIEGALRVLKETYILTGIDNVKYYILAIKLGMGLDEFERAFSVEGIYDTQDLSSWFESHRELFKEEFSDL